MIRRSFRTGILLLTFLFTVASSAQVAEEPVPVVPPPPQKKSSWGAVLTVGLIAAAGTGGWFLYRKMARERRHGDSVITAVEQLWNEAGRLYTEERYRDAIVKLQEITEQWYEYDRYSRKYRRRNGINPDTIRAVIASCDFIERMIPPMKRLSGYAEVLPEDEFALTKMDRHDLDVRRAALRTSIDSILAEHPNHRSALQYGFRHIERRLGIVDSLIEDTYLERKTDFEIKNRFYYNRAVESNDTARLRRFVDDCDYFRVDKEWCQRARMALGGVETSTEVDNALPGSKMSKKDSIRFFFDRTISSKKIEDLEAYIKKYSSRRYRRYKRYTRIREMKAALRLLKTSIDKEVAFNRAYPLLDVRNASNVKVAVKGLSGTTESAFMSVWASLERELVRIPHIRFPITLTIDYSGDPPAIQLYAVVDPETDITTDTINGRRSYRIECLLPAFALLNTLKNGVIMQLESAAENSKDKKVVGYQVKKVGYAAYCVRIDKPDNKGMLIFYARERRGSSGDAQQSVEFYDFYDISATGFTARRFPIYPTSLPNIIPSLSSDSLEQAMGMSFFTGR